MTSAARSFRGCLRADSCFLNVTPFPGQCHPLMAHFSLGRVTLWGSVCSQKSLPGYWCLSGCTAVQFLPLPSSASLTFLSQVLIPKKHPTSQTLISAFLKYAPVRLPWESCELEEEAVCPEAAPEGTGSWGYVLTPLPGSVQVLPHGGPEWKWITQISGSLPGPPHRSIRVILPGSYSSLVCWG